MLDEEGGQHRPQRIQSAEEGGGNAVEAHGGHGGGGALPLLIAREVQQRRAHTGQRAGDHQAENHIPLFRHAAVFSGVFIKAGGLELIAELRPAQHHPYKKRHDQ